MPHDGKAALLERGERTQPAIRNRARSWVLPAILLAAFAVRLALAVSLPIEIHPDEIFQTREAAHRLAFGNGVVTWEYRDGLRNWVFPAFLAVIMRATSWMGAGSLGYTLGVAIALSLLSLSVVWVAYRWAFRVAGPPAAMIAGITCALWHQLVIFSTQALTEMVATYALLPGLYLGYFADSADTDSASPRDARPRLFFSGIFLGLAVALRMQLAPAVLVAMLWFCRANARRWMPMITGAALPIACFGIVDAFTWGHLFASYWNSIVVNVFHHKSTVYGIRPAFWYFPTLWLAMADIALLVVAGMRRGWFLVTIAAAIVATHMLFPHKEYRFVFPAVAMLAIVAGMGLARIVFWRPPSSRARMWAMATCSAVLVAALSTWWMTTHYDWRMQAGRIQTFQELSRRRDLCGLGLDAEWSLAGGYFYLHQNVPMYPLRTVSAPPAAYNYIVGSGNPAAGYKVLECREGACLQLRPGGCVADPQSEINAVLKNTGQ
jgi:GPI mannosyltransferase 3